jgi:predicted ATP-grasp superfamily ATP-dependent carboligase
LLTRLFKKHVAPGDSIKRAVTRDLRTVSKEMSLNELCRVLIRTNFALIDDKYCIELSDLLAKFSPEVVAQPVVVAPTPIVKIEVAPKVEVVAKKEEENSSSSIGSIKWTALGVMMGAGAAILMNKHN